MNNAGAAFEQLNRELRQVGPDGKNGYEKAHERWLAGLPKADREDYERRMAELCRLLGVTEKFE